MTYFIHPSKFSMIRVSVINKVCSKEILVITCSSFLILSQIHSFNKYVLSTYYLWGTIPGTWDISVNKVKKAAIMLPYCSQWTVFFFPPKVLTSNRQKEMAENKNGKLELSHFHACALWLGLVSFSTFPPIHFYKFKTTDTVKTFWDLTSLPLVIANLQRHLLVSFFVILTYYRWFF